jgi:hypothetical protein
VATGAMAAEIKTNERASKRAAAPDVMVAGKGRNRKTGRIVYCTTSSEPGRWHIVTVLARRLQCDCTAGLFGKLCRHRQVVHERMVEERKQLLYAPA